jgi:hypothetical protein
MATYLLRIAGSMLALVALWSCEDAPTNEGGKPDRQSTPSDPAGTPAFSATAGQASTFHFTSNGDFGEVSWFAQDGAGNSSFGFVFVTRGGLPKNTVTFLFYDVTVCDPSFFCSEQFGNGPIPNGDLSGGGQALKPLTLATNTANNPNFENVGGPGGQVTVEWVNNSLSQTRSTGTSETRFENVILRTEGTSISVSATATGSVVGTTIPSASDGFVDADFGSNQGVTVNISR